MYTPVGGELPLRRTTTFDLALAQLVVHFMKDPAAGLREMARVTRPRRGDRRLRGDHAGETGPLSTFWQAARDLDPHVARGVRPARHPRGPTGRAWASARHYGDVESGL